ncbi:hypothetical protein DX130_06130 [Paenibacillus paeoniae]|uniref:Uncharacterized protein n=1 Tax=Paenibacillus paeoniae TaxID=2292705 RepID=A0A371PKA8_9BACL|nr:hypothetical protein DX130_06130 [Paenibacillus paeoniae]
MIWACIDIILIDLMKPSFPFSICCLQQEAGGSRRNIRTSYIIPEASRCRIIFGTRRFLFKCGVFYIPALSGEQRYGGNARKLDFRTGDRNEYTEA